MHPAGQFDVIFRGDHLYTVLHKLPEKRKEVPFAAADMAHPADIHSVDFAFADMPQHFPVSGSQHPSAMRIGAAAHNSAAISMSLQGTNFYAVHGSHIVTGNSGIKPYAAGTKFFFHNFLVSLQYKIRLAMISHLPLSVMLSQVESVSSLSPCWALTPVSYSARAWQADT